MLLPDNVHPEQSVYYNASIVLKYLFHAKEIEVFDLYVNIGAGKTMSIPTYFLSLDWLYLIGLVECNKMGGIKLCI
jgi:hypothetical protein